MDEKMKGNEQQVLLVTEGADPKALKAVTGMDKNGKIKTTNPDSSNLADFLAIDKNGNALENFFKKFFEQNKNPTHTNFFLVAKNVLDKLIKTQPIDQKALEPYRVDPQKLLDKQQEQKQEQSGENTQKSTFQPIDESKINWKQGESLGINKQTLEDAGQLKAMLYGHKSPALNRLTFTTEGISFDTLARLSLKEMPDGTYHFQPHGYLKAPELDKPFFGATLTGKDKENLTQNGNAGRVMELELTPGQKVAALVSLDKITNRLEAVPVEKLNLPPSLKGVELSPEQLAALKEGKAVLIEGMITKQSQDTDNPQKFDAYIQFNAARGSFDFKYDGIDRNRYRQDNNQQQAQGDGQNVRIPKTLLGVNLNDKQQEELRENKAVYIQGMMKDGQDQPFNAYVKINHEKGKLDFFKWNPDKANKQGAEVKVAEANKTQVAVNSEGKTDEATKKVKEPLKQGQTQPGGNQRKPVKKNSSIKV